MRPPRCPRCGASHFQLRVIYSSEGGEEYVYECEECALAYHEPAETWRDENGREWALAESGT